MSEQMTPLRTAAVLLAFLGASGAQTDVRSQAQNHVVFLLNFFDELRRKVPAGK